MIIDRMIDFYNKSENKDLSFLRKSQIVDVQNVADYFYMYNDNEYINLWDYPASFSPCEKCLLTFQLPSKSVSKEFGEISHGDELPNFVIACSAVDNRDSESYIACDYLLEFRRYFKAIGATLHRYDKNKMVIIEDREQLPVMVEEGSAKQEWADLITNLSKIALISFTFCNCKNTKLVENNLSRQYRRSRIRHNNGYVEKFYTISIDANRCNKSNDRTSTDNYGLNGRNSFHVCRGHFKHYGQENPLFGRYVGVVWCPMHTKGDISVGNIEKQYHVEAKK